MRLGTMLLGLMLIGCGGGESERLMDTGWFDDTASFDPAYCPHRIVQTEPVDGATGWYWRSAPTFWADTTVKDRYAVQLVDSQGYLVTDSLVWSETGNTFGLDLSTPLEPSAEYTLRWSDCAEQGEVTFTTSDLGTPLNGDVSDLVGKAYNVDLVGADWVEPGAMGALMSLYFTTPVLLGVQWADDATIDLLGAPGYEDSFGDPSNTFGRRHGLSARRFYGESVLSCTDRSSHL